MKDCTSNKSIWAVEHTASVGQMADNQLLEKVHDLSDVELAALLCLVAQEHCIIDTEPDSISELVEELELVREIKSN